MRHRDEELVQELRFGDREKAANEIAADYYDTLVRRAAKHIGDSKIADPTEVVADVFITILQRDWRNTKIDNLPAYLGMMVQNAVMALFRKKKKIIQIPIPFDVEAPVNVEREVLNKLIFEDVNAIFNFLVKEEVINELEAFTFWLRWRDEHSYKKLGELLNCSPGDIAVTLSHAKKKIRQYCETHPSPFEQLRAVITMNLLYRWKVDEIISKHKKAGSP
jgi:RNA polymerase sigma factor (sigma-70 family)